MQSSNSYLSFFPFTLPFFYPLKTFSHSHTQYHSVTPSVTPTSSLFHTHTHLFFLISSFNHQAGQTQHIFPLLPFLSLTKPLDLSHTQFQPMAPLQPSTQPPTPSHSPASLLCRHSLILPLFTSSSLSLNLSLTHVHSPSPTSFPRHTSSFFCSPPFLRPLFTHILLYYSFPFFLLCPPPTHFFSHRPSLCSSLPPLCFPLFFLSHLHSLTQPLYSTIIISRGAMVWVTSTCGPAVTEVRTMTATATGMLPPCGPLASIRPSTTAPTPTTTSLVPRPSPPPSPTAPRTRAQAWYV